MSVFVHKVDSVLLEAHRSLRGDKGKESGNVGRAQSAGRIVVVVLPAILGPAVDQQIQFFGAIRKSVARNGGHVTAKAQGLECASGKGFVGNFLDI